MSKAYKFQGAGLSSAERKRAKRKFDKYCKIYNYEKINDLELLESLVFHEILILRIKNKIEDLTKSKTVTDAEVVPKIWLERLNDIETQTLTLREKLGLFEDKKAKDPYQIFEEVDKKFEKHREENQADYTAPCPFCQKLIFFIFKVKNYDLNKHPFFKGKFLTNDYLWKLYKTDKKITKEDLAKIYDTRVRYIDFLEKRFYSAS